MTPEIERIIGPDERGCPQHEKPKPDCEDGVCRLAAYGNAIRLFQRQRASFPKPHFPTEMVVSDGA